MVYVTIGLKHWLDKTDILCDRVPVVIVVAKDMVCWVDGARDDLGGAEEITLGDLRNPRRFLARVMEGQGEVWPAT